MTYGAQKQLSRLGTPGFHNTSTSCSGGSWSVSFNMNNSAGTFAQGSLRVNAQQTDQAGNQGSAQRVGVKATVAPTVTISISVPVGQITRACPNAVPPATCNTNTNTPTLKMHVTTPIGFGTISQPFGQPIINFFKTGNAIPIGVFWCDSSAYFTGACSVPAAGSFAGDLIMPFEDVAARIGGANNRQFKNINGTWILTNLSFIKDIAGNAIPLTTQPNYIIENLAPTICTQQPCNITN